MAKQEIEKEKVVTPVQGAEGATDNQESTDTEIVQTPQDSETGNAPDNAPDWAIKLMESNQAVIDSNNEVIESIGEFKEGATDLVEEIFKAYEGGTSEPKMEKLKSVKQPVKVNAKAKYVVCEGKRFADKDNPSFIYEAGHNVSKLATERLQSLLEQGIIEEAK